MVSGNLVVSDGWKIILNRTFKNSPDYLEPSLFMVGQDTSVSPSFSTAGLSKRVPVSSVSVDVLDDCSVANWTESADASAETTNTTDRKSVV